MFVDTLLNAHLLDIDPDGTPGFPGELDATTVGVRTDTGYRFGSFRGGPFIEPLATLSVLWADIDGFALGGNNVSFDDDANVRGRLGLRVGTTMQVWTGTLMEPFVIGSVWGNLSGDNQTLASGGTRFLVEDDLDDVWGEVSAGVNFFNPSASTAVFAKLDVTFATTWTASAARPVCASPGRVPIALRARYGWAYVVARTILPICSGSSMRRWAPAASARVKVESMMGLILPSAMSGQTLCSIALAKRAFASGVCARRVEPVRVSRRIIRRIRSISTLEPFRKAI